MKSHYAESLQPNQLARLLNIARPSGSAASDQFFPDPNASRGTWSARDAADAFRHLLASPLLPEIANFPTAPSNLQNELRDANPTFLTALSTPCVTPAILETIKHFARHVHALTGHPLAGNAATILYYAAIASAAVHTQARITSLADATLAGGYRWSREQPGAETLTPLFDMALSDISNARSGPQPA